MYRYLKFPPFFQVPFSLAYFPPFSFGHEPNTSANAATP